MKVSREQAAENRELIIQTATQLFREKGFDGIGIAELMKTVGLTHGGFYGHFSSKDDLISQACDRAVDDILAQGAEARKNSSNPFENFIQRYLSTEHRDNPGSGCLMAALGSEVPRQSPQIKASFTRGFSKMVDGVMGLLTSEKKAALRREKALFTLSALVGAQIIARAMGDEELSQDVLESVKKQLIKH